MWWLAVPAVGAGIVVVYQWLKREAGESRRRFEDRYESVSREVTDHNKVLKQHLRQAQKSVDFHLLTSVHFSSWKVADTVHSSLRDARKSSACLREAMGNLRQARDECKTRLDAHPRPTGAAREEILGEMAGLRDAMIALSEDLRSVHTRVDHLSGQVSTLNMQTRELKEAIRDRCGSRGREWYQALNERAESRRKKEAARRA